MGIHVRFFLFFVSFTEPGGAAACTAPRAVAQGSHANRWHSCKGECKWFDHAAFDYHIGRLRASTWGSLGHDGSGTCTVPAFGQAVQEELGTNSAVKNVRMLSDVWP